MSRYTTRHVHEKTRFGFIDEVKQNIWSLAHYDVYEAISKGLLFPGPIPVDVAEKLLDWEPRASAARFDAPADQVTKAIQVTDRSLKDLEFSALANGWTEEELAARRTELFRTLIDLAAPVAPDFQAIVGEDGIPLNYPSASYGMHDHKAVLLRSAEALLGSGAAIASVGCLGGGDFMFMSYRVDRAVFSPLGEVYPYVSTGTSHGSKLKSHVSCSSILRQCDNTTMADFNRAEAKGRAYKVKHTSRAKFDLAVAAETLDLAIARTEAWAEGVTILANEAVTEAQRVRFLDVSIPLPEEDGRSRTIALNKRAEFLKILDRDPRVPTDQRMTLAGLWQAHNTYNQWAETVRGNSDPLAKTAKQVMTTGIDSDAAFWDVISKMDEFSTLAKDLAKTPVAV